MANIHRDFGAIESKGEWKLSDDYKDCSKGACICMKCFKIFEPVKPIYVFDFFLCPEHNPIYLNFEVK